MALNHVLSHVSHTKEVLSNISGSLSIACWVILLLPQLLEQWRLKSADGVALGFILMWFFGDLANLLGSIMGGLRPSVTLLALWFCFSDTLLILSYFYYKNLASKSGSNSSARSRVPSPANNNSLSPIDGERNDSHNSSGANSIVNASTPLLHEETQNSTPPVNHGAVMRRNWLLSTGLPAIFVIVVATLSYFISDSASSDDDGRQIDPGNQAEFLGYLSAFLYLVARIPQIIQNHRRRSVEGLSMGFFTLSILGNVTYASQVIIYRSDREWLIAYIPWLLGSLGTIVEDLIILAQFHIYKGWTSV